MYNVIERFMDLQDDNYIYEVGDAYPREGADPTLERIRELAGSKNRLHKPLIEAVQQEEDKQKRKTATKSRKREG